MINQEYVREDEPIGNGISFTIVKKASLEPINAERDLAQQRLCEIKECQDRLTKALERITELENRLSIIEKAKT